MAQPRTSAQPWFHLRSPLIPSMSCHRFDRGGDPALGAPAGTLFFGCQKLLAGLSGKAPALTTWAGGLKTDAPVYELRGTKVSCPPPRDSFKCQKKNLKQDTPPPFLAYLLSITKSYLLSPNLSPILSPRSYILSYFLSYLLSPHQILEPARIWLWVSQEMLIMLIIGPG